MDPDEPIERLQELIVHPADKTFNTIHDQGLKAKKELAEERQALLLLLSQLPDKAPHKGTKEYDSYVALEGQIETLKKKISQKHDELMELLKNEEKISREIQEKNS